MQARIGALGQKAAGIVAMVGDTRVRHLWGIGVAMIGDVAYRQAAIVQHRDGGCVAE
ncbi:C component of insecticidal toxin complex [Pseudomonas sp. CK-NBRI-02]|nr:C component of insecticidal toxin complex [Pseudomonas sp. CK-NBRI-02]